jgi:glycosyltransferase involved in cell wall biosynthesis
VTVRVALVTEIIAPYRLPVFNALNELLDGGLTVFFIAETEARRTWPIHRDEIAFQHEVLGGVHFDVPYRGDRQPVYVARPLFPRLERGAFDAVIVGGWNHLECYQALAWARIRRRRFVLWSETPLLGTLPSRRIRNALKRLVVRGADSFVVPGPSAAAYLEALGAPHDAIRPAPNAVDNSYWGRIPAELPRREGLTLLFVGRLVHVKGVDIALGAFGRSRLAGAATFLIAGDGPERAGLERGAPPGVRFLGDLGRDDLRVLYHSCDMLVFPSRYDPWGLVVNEAACAGLPVIGSTGAGATCDMIVDGENGLRVPAGDVDALRAAFDRLAGEPDLPARLRPGAAALAERHSPAACAAGLFAALS